jgi:hypothetical protein
MMQGTFLVPLVLTFSPRLPAFAVKKINEENGQTVPKWYIFGTF